jgi:hypothetical protein
MTRLRQPLSGAAGRDMRTTKSPWPRLLTNPRGTAPRRVLLVSSGLTVSVILLEMLPSFGTGTVAPKTDQGTIASPGVAGEQEPSSAPGVRSVRVVYVGPLMSSSGAASVAPNATPHPSGTSPGGTTTASSVLPALPTPTSGISPETPRLAEDAPDARPAPRTVTAASTDAAARTEPPVRPVDLNTASIEELNGLGGGMIGRAIIGARPYMSVEDLLSKRVLNRATYRLVADQVSVR